MENTGKEQEQVNEKELLRMEYAQYLESCEIKENYIMYEAFGGRGMVCSPYAIFKHLLARQDFKEYIHVWAIDDFEDNVWQMARYESCGNVRFVKYQSPKYREYLASCKYLVNNVGFSGYFTKREGQIYVNTWHGIPLKTIGFDIPAGRVSAGNSAKNLLAADYLISPNAFMTDIYKKAYRMDGLYAGTILQEGQPRNDSFYHTGRMDVIAMLKSCGVEVDPDKKIILYAPTWKGSQYRNPDVGLDIYYEIIRRVEKSVDTSKYQILVKPHQIVYYHIKNTQGVTGQFIPATVDANELLAAVDVLISDYSSIYFDFLVSGRPVLFFIPDLQEYREYRGLYFGIDKLPGPIAESYEELEGLVCDPQKAMEPFRKKYMEEQKWACPGDDGNVCARVVDAVFGGKASEMAVRCGTKKKKVLFFAGDFEDDIETRMLIKFLEKMNYDKFDVTVVLGGAKEPGAQERILGLPPQVRILYRAMKYNATQEETELHKELIKKGLKPGLKVPEQMYRRELRRLFGEAQFDYAAAFVERPGIFLLLLLYMVEGKKCLFLCGDLQKELEENKRLKLGISVLHRVDKVVSSSFSLMKVNREHFHRKDGHAAFTWMKFGEDQKISAWRLNRLFKN